MKKLSIVVPCYNEEKNIPSLLERYTGVVGLRDDIEVIIVNDGSKDKTQEILEKEKIKCPFLKVINIYPNVGYGGAVFQGLKESSGEYIGWTHGDLQASPEDILTVLTLIEQSKNREQLYIKGRRHSRPIADTFFTSGMSFLESVLFRTLLVDINAQPNIFHNSFLDKWQNPPKDFSLDLYALVLAKRNHLSVKRFPVSFSPRLAGVSSWNTSWQNKFKFIKRTISFSLDLLRKGI